MMEHGQLTFEDLEYMERLTSQPGRSAYIDECGNFGFDFSKDGISTHYILCAVVVNNTQIPEINQKVKELRKSNFGSSEMKSSSIGKKHSRRAKVLTELLQLDFSLIVLIADKQLFYKDSPLSNYKRSFVKYLHQELYDSMYAVFPKLKIIEDEYGSSEFQKGYRKYISEHRPELNLLNEYDFDYVDSKNSNIVQVADIIAGSVMQNILDTNAPDVLKIFQGKILDIINFPKTYVPNVAGTNTDNYFDEQIYALANHCATNYIENHKNNDEYDVRIRILFLKYLLFTVRNMSVTKYVYSGEIIKRLSDIFEKRITRNYLYRRIIAPLRDSGVLIASSAHGYKIPACLDAKDMAAIFV